MPHTHDVEIRRDEVRKTYVSWGEGEPDREWAALELLSRCAPGLAPAPISRTEVDGRPVVVMSRVAGSPLAGRLTPTQARGLSAALRRLFDVPVPEGASVRANDPIGFSQRFGSWLGEEYDWSLCRDPSLVREALAGARNWLDRHPVPDEWIVDPVVALGDGNLDNVMWDGATCRLIDWEEYGVSDVAYEVADLVEHASSRLERRLDTATLVEGLSLSEQQCERVQHHRPRFAAFWLAMLLPGNGGWHRNPAGSTEDQARHLLQLVDR